MIRVANNSPIGVFDSGIGGLSVLHHLREQLPFEDMLYIADSAFAPYGTRPIAEIQKRSEAICEFLIDQRAKAIVVACNTATAAAVHRLRQRYDLPIIGMEPGLKPAIAQTRSGKVAVLGTDNTLTSEKFSQLIDTVATDTEIIIQACTDLVSYIERGELDGIELRQSLEKIILPLVATGVDTLVLGCTHYPLALGQIQQLAGPDVNVIDTGGAVARETRRRLVERQLLAQEERIATEQIWSSSSAKSTHAVIKRLWPSVAEIGLFNLSTAIRD